MLPSVVQQENGSADPAAGADDQVEATRSGSTSQPLKVARTFAWQEKVYSKAELVAAQVIIQLPNITAVSTERAGHLHCVL